MAISNSYGAFRDRIQAIGPIAESARSTIQISIDDQPASKTTLTDYGGFDFKETLAACPIDGIDLTELGSQEAHSESLQTLFRYT